MKYVCTIVLLVIVGLDQDVMVLLFLFFVHQHHGKYAIILTLELIPFPHPPRKHVL
jgi:hypothetical protein